MKKPIALFLAFWLSVFSIISLSVNASDLSLMRMGNTTTGSAALEEPTFPTVGGVTCRYKANSLALSDGNTVATWEDETASNFDLTQGTEASKPVYRAAPTGFNGWPALEFDTVAKMARAGAETDYVSVGASTVYVVFRVDTHVADTGSPWTNPGLWHIGVRQGLHTYTDTLQSFNHDGSNDTAITTTISEDTTYLGILKHEGGNISVAINGGAFTDTASGNLAGGNGDISVGAAYSTNTVQGWISEVVVSNEAHDSTELADMRTYFNTKYMIY